MSSTYDAPTPPTSVAAATIQAKNRSAAPTIRHDFRCVTMPLIHAVAETINAASESPTVDEAKIAAAGRRQWLAHNDELSQRLRFNTTTPTTQAIATAPQTAVTEAGVNVDSKGDNTHDTND